MNLYGLKLRCAQRDDSLEHGNEKHVAGAERMVAEENILPVAQSLLHRALHRSEELPDLVSLKIEKLNRSDVLELDALSVRTIEVPDADAGICEVRKILEAMSLPNIPGILELLQSKQNIRGAVLLNVDTFERLEPNQQRGIRATYMDADTVYVDAVKNHFREALVLATKTASAPNIIGEICISDDPDYVTGYVASKDIGYVRITHLKKLGSPYGKRIFLYRGNVSEVARCIAYLENQKVLVKNVPHRAQNASEGLPGLRHKFCELAVQLDTIIAEQLYRECKTVPSENVLMFASNNYLGLANAPEVKAFAVEQLERYGIGSGGSRLTCGTTGLHTLLETRLAEFKQTESALVFNSGFSANIGIIPAICKAGDVIFSDELNHASLIDGCRLSKAETVIYRHNDMDDLESKISSHLKVGRPGVSGMVVSDAVFSMDGDILHYPRFMEIADRYGLFSMLDEAHSTGVLGRNGTGIAEHFGMTRQPDILMGSLSKALGSEGGFVCGSELLISFLRNKARSFIFSTSLSPVIIAAALQSLEILMQNPARVQKLRDNVQYFCRNLHEQGINVHTESAIIPIIVGKEEIAMQLAERLLNEGIFASAIRYPTVKRGEARLRLTIMATHSQAELLWAAERIVKALGQCGICRSMPMPN